MLNSLDAVHTKGEGLQMQRKKPPIKRGVYAVTACVGLFAAGIWANLVGYGGVFMDPAMTDSSFEVMRYMYHGGRVIAALSLVVAPALYERKQDTLRLCVPLLMCFSTAAFVFAYYQTLVPPFILSCGASFVLGYSYLWAVASLYVAIARSFSMRSAIEIALAGQVLEQVASMAANYGLPSWGQIIVCCLCPLVIMFCLMMLKRTSVADERNPLTGAARTHTVLLLVISGVTVVMLGAVSVVGVWGNARADYVAYSIEDAFAKTVVTCAILIAFAIVSLLPTIGRPLSYRYQTSLLIVVGSLMLASIRPYAAEGVSAEIIAYVLTATEYFSHVLLWVIVMRAIKDNVGRPFALAGIGLISFSSASFVWLFLLETNQNASIAFALLVSYILVTAAAVHPRLLYERSRHKLVSSDALNEYTMDGEPEIPVESNGAAVADMVERRCKLLGEQYHLSNRETQVLFLLAQGRSRPIIQEQLVLSQGTVKTHLAHIYEKMEVGSHQEVLNIVYGENAD